MNKKTLNIGLIAILIASAITVSFNSINAEGLDQKTIYGTLYIDTNNDGNYEIAPAGIDIIIEVNEYTNTKQTLEYDEINYLIGIEPEHTNETCYINISYYGKSYTPDDNQSIVLSEENENGPDPGYYIIDLHVTVIDNPPEKVTGLTVTDAKDGKLNLEWDPANDDFGIDHYKIYKDSTFLTNTTSTTYQDTGLTNGQEYCYQISAVDISDLEGEKSDEDCATPTETYTPPGPGPGPGPSDDDDDDTTTGDDDDDDDTEVIPNNPPVIIEFTGDYLTGSKNEELSFFAISEAPEEDQKVNFTFYWDDGTMNITEYFDNGTRYNITHTWTAAGVYNIWAKSWDNYPNETSGVPSVKSELQVLIDAHIIDNGDVDGYLTDDNSNGTYDNFHNNEDGSDSGVGTEGSLYLLDTDGDGEYDYKYDPNTGLGETIEDNTQDETSGDTESTGEDNTLLYVGAALIIIILLILFFLATRKKDKGKK